MSVVPAEPLECMVGFRTTTTIANAIEAHRQTRRLEKQSDAARELMARGIAGNAVDSLAAELTRLTNDPTAPARALRDALATIERDNALSPQPASR